MAHKGHVKTTNGIHYMNILWAHNPNLEHKYVTVGWKIRIDKPIILRMHSLTWHVQNYNHIGSLWWKLNLEILVLILSWPSVCIMSPETQQQSWTKRVCKHWPLVVSCPDNCFSPSPLYAIFRNSEWLWHKFWHIWFLYSAMNKI